MQHFLNQIFEVNTLDNCQCIYLILETSLPEKSILKFLIEKSRNENKKKETSFIKNKKLNYMYLLHLYNIYFFLRRTTNLLYDLHLDF